MTYSRNDLNRTNVFNLYGVYDLPFGHGQKYAGGANRLVNYAIGGWELSGTSTWMSGLPFTPTYAECNADEDVDTSVSSGVLCRPNGSPMSLPHGAQAFNTATHTVTFFTPVAPLSQNGSSSGPFQRPAFGIVGNSGRNSFTGPREFLANASLSKTFPITQRVNGQFIFQASNLFNHPALSLPTASNETNGPCIDCSLSAGGTPGQIVGLDQNVNMRQLQFAVRVSF